MPNSAQPFDPNYTNFNFGDTPGAADFDRLQNNQKYVSSMPFLMLARSTDLPVGTGVTPNDVKFDTIVQTNDTSTPSMVTFTSGFSSKILVPYVGDVEIKCHIRQTFTNSSGVAQVFLYKTYTSGHADVLLDEDEAPCTTVGAVHLRMSCDSQIVAGDLALGAGFKLQYCQNSGASATITADGNPYYAYPRFSVRVVGTSAT